VAMFLYEGNDISDLDGPHPCSGWQSLMKYEGGHATLRYPSPQVGSGPPNWFTTIQVSPGPYVLRALSNYSSLADYGAMWMESITTRPSREGGESQEEAILHLSDVLKAAREEASAAGSSFVAFIIPKPSRLIASPWQRPWFSARSIAPHIEEIFQRSGVQLV